MPVPSFVVCELFVWPPPPEPAQAPAALQGRKPRAKPAAQPKAKRRPRPARRVIPVQVRTILDDRLNAAIESGLIELCDEDMACESLDMTLAELALLMKILLAEEYEAPKRKPRKASASAPASDGRIQVYAERRTAGCELYHPKDATAHRAHDRGVQIVQRKNGSGVKVVGWAEG
jgi:hypothetical protein